jgi:tetratricopeptide (TPR) repeat protein
MSHFDTLASRGLILLVTVFFLVGCSQEESPADKAEVKQEQLALNEPIAVQRVELSTEILAVWRQYAARKPTLLLLSDQPMLLPVPASLSNAVGEFVTTAKPSELARRSHPKAADVLLMPDMTVDIALRQKWVGKLAWALPFRNPDQPLTLERFQRQLKQKGLATEEERDSLQGDSKLITGRLRGVPVELATLEHLPPISGPVIIHIDLSYFKRRYKSDVATPLLNLIFETLTKLRERQATVLAVTFCYGNLDERIALDVRFVGDIVADLFARPQMFDEPVPDDWQRQGQILYLNGFFQKERQRELALALEESLPETAWVKYNLYQSAAAHKEGDAALDYLAQAVQRDKVYAMEYLFLAEMAYDKGLPAEALRMLRLADTGLPDNPMIRLQIAQLSAELGDQETALLIVRQLQALPWSTVYQAPLEEYLRGFADSLEKQPVSSPLSADHQKQKPGIQSDHRVLHPEQTKPVSPARP